MKVMFGYSILGEMYTSENHLVYDKPSLNEAVAELMKNIEHTEYSVPDYESVENGQLCVYVRYNRPYNKYSQVITVYCNTLLEIEGRMFMLNLSPYHFTHVNGK